MLSAGWKRGGSRGRLGCASAATGSVLRAVDAFLGVPESGVLATAWEEALYSGVAAQLAQLVGSEEHRAGSTKEDGKKARHLVRAAQRAGARHLGYISVVGADRVPQASGMERAMFGYFGSKLAAERIVANSGLPWTTLRATQFYDLALMTAQQMAKMPVIPVPATPAIVGVACAESYMVARLDSSRAKWLPSGSVKYAVMP